MLFSCQPFRNILVLIFNNIDQTDLVAFLIRSDRVIKIHISCCFLPCPEVHQQFILNASGGIAGKPYPLGFIKRIHRLDQTDRSYGNKIFHVPIHRGILFGDICDQTQIALDQSIPRILISRPAPFQILSFLFCAGRLWKRLHNDIPLSRFPSILCAREDVCAFPTRFFTAPMPADIFLFPYTP